jgi:CMD domain protein
MRCWLSKKDAGERSRTMSTEPKDVIDLLAGIEPGSSLDGIRARRLQARENAQKSYLALFEPADIGEVAVAERYAVAAFVAGIHAEPAAASLYSARFARSAARSELIDVLEAEIERAKTEGPYGVFPAGPLSVEGKGGLIYRVAGKNRSVLGGRLAAALEHAHLLVFHPRDANPAAIRALLEAGWSNTATVTLSQLVAFLCFQIRTIAGLRTLARRSGAAQAFQPKPIEGARSCQRQSSFTPAGISR